MKAHRSACCSSARRPRRAGASGAAFGFVFAVLAALTPKCPLCIAAWLGVVGLSGLATRLDPRALWFFCVFAVAAVGAAATHRWLNRGETMKGDER